VRGKAVHKLIEYALRAKIAGVVLEPGGLSAAWDIAWDQAAEGAEFQPDEDIDALKAAGAGLAQKYVCEALPAIEPAAVEVPFSGIIAGVAVRGIADLMTTDGTIIDVKTASRKPSAVAADHALQLGTYADLLPSASGRARIDTLVGTKDPQLVQIDYTPGEAGRRLWSASIRWWPRASRAGCICRTAARAFAASGIARLPLNANTSLGDTCRHERHSYRSNARASAEVNPIAMPRARAPS